MTEFTVRPAELHDVEAIRVTQAEGWLSTWAGVAPGPPASSLWRVEGDDREAVRRRARRIRDGVAAAAAGQPQVWLVADSPDGVIGYTAGIVSGGVHNFMGLYVSRRGGGAGSALLAAALEWHGGSCDVRLRITAGSQRAARFYEGRGFRAAGEGTAEVMTQVLDAPLAQLLMVRPASHPGQPCYWCRA
jgi:GNAT superfamily N-acetyltransferase